MFSEAVENYLTEILRLEEHAGRGAVSPSALADRLAVARPSVTGMLQRLADDDLVRYAPYRGVRLTRRGRRTARQMLRRHRLVETFLVRALGMPADRVHDEAHRWEHALSDDAVDRLDRWLGRPEADPHGTPIPAAPPSRGQRRLATLAAGVRATVTMVASQGPDHAAYLRSLGLAPGAVVTVTERRPFQGPVTLTIGDHSWIVGPEVTEYVSVREET
ncbi:metal-dependent transcriptional regulator [bacterium]|nr:metal-dependent transcriptional regulator [bacterium]